MTDNKKPVSDKPVVEPKDEKSQAPAPKTDQPTDSGDAPVSDSAAPAGTDQQGRQLYNVTCAACGKPTQVPFKPSGDRPVYCKDCYLKQKRG